MDLLKIERWEPVRKNAVDLKKLNGKVFRSQKVLLRMLFNTKQDPLDVEFGYLKGQFENNQQSFKVTLSDKKEIFVKIQSGEMADSIGRKYSTYTIYEII